MANTFQTQSTRHFSIPQHNVAWLQDQINLLAKRAAKLGVTPPTLRVHSTTRKPDASGNLLWMCEVEVAGEAPVLPGWALVAVINVIEGEGIFKPLPGVLLPEYFINADAQYCDHCRTRRVRNDTFVLQADDGMTFKQVGRSCLKDFIPGGHTSPEALAWFAHAMDAAVNAARDAVTGSHGINNPNYIDMHQYLSKVAARSRTHGWISSRDAWEKGIACTADVALRADPYQVLPEDRDLAIRSMEWAANLPDNQTENNEYLHNIATLSRLGVLDGRTYRIGASIISAYSREQTKAAQNFFKPVNERGYVGTVGQKIRVNATVSGKPVAFVGQYGPTYIYKFAVDGNVVVWYSKTSDDHLTPGKQVTLLGTIKSHETYRPKNGGEITPQTVINYVKVA